MIRTRSHSVIVAALLGLAAAPGFAATFTVSKIADTNDGTCDADCSLREAIVAANAAAGADTIVFSAATNGSPLVLASNLPAFDSAGGDWTITGNGPANTIIDGNNTYRMFSSTGNVSRTLQNLTLRNARNVGDQGGALFARFGTVVIDQAAFLNNYAEFDGGAVYALGQR